MSIPSPQSPPRDGMTPPSDVPSGSFPFPLNDSQDESRYLTWIRNHSKYMAVRGFLDYFRSISVLLRGIVLNFLIILPLLLFVAIGLAYGHHWMLANPYVLTKAAVAIAVAAILLSPVAAQLAKIFSYRRGIETGSESSVKLRDKYERLFGALLMLILGIAILESLPPVLEWIRDLVESKRLGTQSSVAAVLGALAILSGSDKIVSALSGVKKTLAMACVGLLGILVPVAVVLFATDYLLYGFLPSPYFLLLVIFVLALFVVAVSIAILIGVIRGAFRVREFAAVALLLVVSFLTLAGTASYVEGKLQSQTQAARLELEDMLAPLTKLANGLRGFTEARDIEDTMAAVFDEFQTANRALQDHHDNQDTDDFSFALPPPPFHCKDTPQCWRKRFKQLKSHLQWDNFRAYWKNEQQRWQEYKDEVSLTLPLASILIDLQSRKEHQLIEPRAMLVDLARKQALEVSPSTNTVISRSEIDTALDPTEFYKTSREYRDNIAARYDIRDFTAEQLNRIRNDNSTLADDLIVKLMYGAFAGLEHDPQASLAFQSRRTGTAINTIALFVALCAVLIWLGCWLMVDVNLTSIHGLYRDRLAAAFLIGKDVKGDVDIEQDLDLHQIGRYEENCVAPYHLINVALNLQASKELRIRDRQSDFFIFSKRFVGGQRTGYCRSEILEEVFPQMSLATAMAISAAAASPNMGRGTSPLLVAFMTILNVRLGFWVPNPGLLESQNSRSLVPFLFRRRRAQDAPPGFGFDEVFAQEMQDIRQRWRNLATNGQAQRHSDSSLDRPTVEHGLVGIAYSGGGIRSAAINLGITQALHAAGVFQHADYMSTVSGGGYLGSSISALMRCATADGTTGSQPVRAAAGCSDIAGRVRIDTAAPGSDEKTIRVFADDSTAGESREYRFTRFDEIVVKDGEKITAGQSLVRRRNTIADRFGWRIRPLAFVREMLGKLNETHRWVNLSDGGHIENLATVELLRRRCKYIIIGDGEADPKLHFAGLATLMRSAYLDLGIRIDINVDAIRLTEDDTAGANTAVSTDHFAIGKIHYPKTPDHSQPEQGYLLYLKSSYSGDENEVIREYRNRNPTFPHQTTADQFFDEGQFEAYRALGEHIATQALHVKHSARSQGEPEESGQMTYAELENWFTALLQRRAKAHDAAAP